VARLRRQGERYYAMVRGTCPKRRLVILAVCALEWRASLADAVVETHDRIVGRLYRASERLCSTRIADEKAAVRGHTEILCRNRRCIAGAQDDGTALDGMRTPGIKGATDRPVAPD
jgi:hypothetical protein